MQWKFVQLHKKIAKIWQILNEPIRNDPKTLNFYQGGKISPHMVTLVVEIQRERERDGVAH